jgi:hypothetical protein
MHPRNQRPPRLTLFAPQKVIIGPKSAHFSTNFGGILTTYLGPTPFDFSLILAPIVTYLSRSRD